jgi:hypothetical protein
MSVLLTGLSARSAQLHTTIIIPNYHLQYVALSYLHECMIDTVGYVHMYKSYFGLHCNSCITVRGVGNGKCVGNIRLNY